MSPPPYVSPVSPVSPCLSLLCLSLSLPVSLCLPLPHSLQCIEIYAYTRTYILLGSLHSIGYPFRLTL